MEASLAGPRFVRGFSFLAYLDNGR